MLCKFRCQAFCSSGFTRKSSLWISIRRVFHSSFLQDDLVSANSSSSSQLSPLLPLKEEYVKNLQSVKPDENVGHTIDKEMETLPDFALIGVRKSVRAALHESFPSIRSPTACQTAFIPAILQRKDVILRDKTGTGK